MGAGQHPDPGQRPLRGEALADLAEHRHLTGGPFDPAAALGGERRVLDVEFA